MEGYEVLDCIVEVLNFLFPGIEHIMNYKMLYPHEYYYELYLYYEGKRVNYFTLYDNPRKHKYTKEQCLIMAGRIAEDIKEVL